MEYPFIYGGLMLGVVLLGVLVARLLERPGETEDIYFSQYEETRDMIDSGPDCE